MKVLIKLRQEKMDLVLQGIDFKKNWVIQKLIEKREEKWEFYQRFTQGRK